MELFRSARRPHHQQAHQGGESHQMLTLNRRLETYLGHVKLLEEQNEGLRWEIQALRKDSQGACSHRKGLEKELRHARLELDAAWSKKDSTELEVGSLAEELRVLGLRRQREAEARAEALRELEVSRKEMEEEQRAQIWLREKVKQLEGEIEHQMRTHQDEVSHLEASLAYYRSTQPTMLAPVHNKVSNVLQFGHEYSQRATRVWQEAAEAYQAQVARLEESLSQARGRLVEVDREKTESLMELRALEKELALAQNSRQCLERSTAQQRDRIDQEIQQLQDQLEGLVVEKEELGQEIDALLTDSNNLLQVKMSLGLEVATYRALLDNESLRGGQSRVTYIDDSISSPRGVKNNYKMELSASQKTTPIYSLQFHRVNGMPSTKAAGCYKPVSLNKTPCISQTKADDHTEFSVNSTKPLSWSTPYPKVQNGAVEEFRPQDVHEEVNYAEPLSPPNEQEVAAETLVGSHHMDTITREMEDERDWGTLTAPLPDEGPVLETSFSLQTESFSSEPEELNTEAEESGALAAFGVPITEDSLHFELCGKGPDERNAAVDTQAGDGLAVSKENVQEESSESETEAVLEATFETSTSSRASECEAENVFDQLAQVTQEESRSFVDAQVTRTEEGAVGRTEEEIEDKLYPDGEEMDTWDSVIERKVEPKIEYSMIKEEGNTLHAEPEEDISTREYEQQDVKATAKPNDEQKESIDLQEENVDVPDKDQEDQLEEEDSPNISVSWRTELEGDSYAQDNTLADTRPLIRYKSDETDANTQASHLDESESSEGEEDRKMGGTEAGTWGKCESKRFGTMEDLCEETEGEPLDEDYEMGYTHMENVGIGQDSEYAGLQIDKECAEDEVVMKVSKELFNEDTEELNKPSELRGFSDVDYNEELDSVDRLVEQELENLSTAAYSVQFAKQKAPEYEAVVSLQARSDTDSMEEEEIDLITTKDSFFCPEPEDQNPQTKAEEGKAGDKHDVSVVSHFDLTEDQSIYTDFNDRLVSQVNTSHSDMEDSNSSEDESPNASQYSQQMHPENVSGNTKQVVDAVESDKVQETASNPILTCPPIKAFPDLQQSTEWDALEVPGKDLVDNQVYENVPEKTQHYFHEDDHTHHVTMTQGNEFTESSSDNIPMEADIFSMKEQKDLLKTNAKDKDPHGLFSSGLSNDFWASAMEKGATCQPDGSHNQEAEPPNLNTAFDDNLAWGNLENPPVANGNTKMGTDKEMEQQRSSEGKPLLCKDVVESQLDQSEDSEDERKSWSSGEE